ncbi:MAG: DNA mismatch repair protein MutS [Deltaproteobacteria bacterium]|jgi:DNA mismatch repair protein MutS|nr:DNA mismatch repair protein MutS [Deltaproteobacteria bacterium]
MAKTTPMMQQYLEIKSEYPDAILFFRLGDFYEMFMEDAVVAARVLDITLTSRNKGATAEIPLCGVPFHSCQPYVAKLVQNGHKVAICEQVEDPKQAKGIVKRAVVRVVTPGLVVDTDTLDPRRNNYLMALMPDKNGCYGVACVDITTGEFRVTELLDPESTAGEIISRDPAEVLVVEGESGDSLVNLLQGSLQGRNVNRLPEWAAAEDRARLMLLESFPDSSMESFGCHDMPAAVRAAGMILYYLEETQKGSISHLQPLQTYHVRDHMVLDDFTRRNLELTETLHDGGRRGSLLGVMDRTVTAMGARKLRHWMTHPLVDRQRIEERHVAVEELVRESLCRDDLRRALDEVYDLERLNGRIAMATGNAKDLAALRISLEKLPQIIDLLAPLDSPMLTGLRESLDTLPDMAALISGSIVDDPPFVLREGGLIREGYHSELDELRSISREGKGWIARLEQEEKEKTGISNLKVRYNRVFGYYIEVTKSQLDRVPEDYQRKQTLANAERYITPTLKEYEEKVLGAEDRVVEIEYDLFQKVRRQVATQGQRIQATADKVAILDILLGLADLSHERNYCRPEMDESTDLLIEDGRHPVIETMNLGERFVANDVHMDTEERQILIITGPNMAGKSTFMRQVALLVLMAQMGCLVPAKKARIGIVDRIFTRVGASDNLARGQSTFMVEMTEAANILNHATPRSLIVLDEIGRGTSTFDGVSIAWAVAEYLHDNAKVAAKTLFATHYHELTDLALTRERVQNYNVAVKEWDDQIIFLRRIVKGGASHSYGIQVARLAGLPADVISRAKEVLHNLESGEYVAGTPRLARSRQDRKTVVTPQLGLFEQPDSVRTKLEETDVSILTPLEALNLLDELKKML